MDLARSRIQGPRCPISINVAAHFKHMLERPSVKKLLAYEKEVNEGFAETA
jgi:hypothetical protein